MMWLIVPLITIRYVGWIYQHKVNGFSNFELYLDDPQGSNANCGEQDSN